MAGRLNDIKGMVAKFATWLEKIEHLYRVADPYVTAAGKAGRSILGWHSAPGNSGTQHSGAEELHSAGTGTTTDVISKTASDDEDSEGDGSSRSTRRVSRRNLK